MQRGCMKVAFLTPGVERCDDPRRRVRQLRVHARDDIVNRLEHGDIRSNVIPL